MNVIQQLLALPIWLYRWLISPALHVLVGPTAGCRFTPTCSVYALEALETHGALRGSALTLRRLCRCHPWGGYGDDRVPPPQPPTARADARAGITLVSPS